MASTFTKMFRGERRENAPRTSVDANALIVDASTTNESTGDRVANNDRAAVAAGARDDDDDDDDDDRVEASLTSAHIKGRSTTNSPSGSKTSRSTLGVARESVERRGKEREIDYKDTKARAGLRAGDVVAFATPNEGFPYVSACVNDDEGGNVEKKYKFVIDVDGKSGANVLRERKETQLEVMRHEAFVGFRGVRTDGRLLQATRHGRSRLGFASVNFGTWEEWALDAETMKKLNESAWMRCEATLKHRRLDAYELKVTIVRVGRVVEGSERDGTDEPLKLPLAGSRQSTPGGASTKALSAVDRRRPLNEHDGATPIRPPHAMHAMGGVMMKEFASALEKEVAARKVVEQELHELHEADDKLREWALSELNRLRAFAQKEVDMLAGEVEERNKKMADLKQQRRALELRSKMLESLDEERLEAVSRAFNRIQTGNALKRAFAHWRRSTQGLSKMNNIEMAFGKYHTKTNNKRMLTTSLEAWRREVIQGKRVKRIYSSVLNRCKFIAFQTWANEMRNNKLRREVSERIAPSRRIATYLNGALTVGFQMRCEVKQHQHKTNVVAHAQGLGGNVRSQLVASAFEVGLECENAATYKLTDALSDPIGAINLARRSALRNIAEDTVTASEITFAFDQGILVASRMIQIRCMFMWEHADTVQEAMTLTSAFDAGEDEENVSPKARSAARKKVLASVASLPPRQARTIASAFYRGNFSRDFAVERKSVVQFQEAFEAGLEAGLCRYKRRELASQAANDEESSAVVAAFDSGIARACLSVQSNTGARAHVILDSAEEDDRHTVAWMRETLMTTIEVASGNISSLSSELLLHKILYPLRTDTLRFVFSAWLKDHRAMKEENLVAKRFSDRRAKRVKKEALLSWYNEASAAKKRQRVLGRAVMKMRNVAVTSAFTCWRENVSKCARDRAVLSRIILRIKNRTLQAAFTKWAEMCGKNDRVDRMAVIMNGRMRRLELAKAFDGWFASVQATRLNRQRASSFLVRYTKSSLSRSFNAWAENASELVTQRRKCEMVIKRSRNRVAAAAFYQWRDLVQENRKRRILMQNFITRMRLRTVSKVMNQWYDVSREGTRKCVLIQQTFNRIKNEGLSRAFNRWHEATIERVEQKKSLRKIVGRMLRLKLSQSFTVWHENTVELSRQRVIIQKFVARATKRSMVQCFYAWVDAIEQAKVQAKATAYRDRLIANVVSRTNRSTLRLAMEKWREVVNEREIHREIIRRNLRAKRVAMNFFMNWYWDAFDNDIQETMANMFGQTRTYMNEAFDDRSALDFDVNGYSPPPPSFRASGPNSEFHTPSKAMAEASDDNRFFSAAVAERLIDHVASRPFSDDDADARIDEESSDIDEDSGDRFLD